MSTKDLLKDLESLDISSLTPGDVSNIRNESLRKILTTLINEHKADLSARSFGGRLAGKIKHSSHQQEEAVPEPEPSEDL